MSLIDSINIDVWMYNILPYLLSSDQYNLSQACCLKIGHAAPRAPNCSDDTTSASSPNKVPTPLQSYLSTRQILSRTQKRIVTNFHASSLAIARHFQVAEEFNFKQADISTEKETEERLKEVMKMNASNLQRLVNDEMQPKSRSTPPLALNSELLFTKGVHWSCLSGRPAETEYEESYCSFFNPNSFKQLKCGLVLPTQSYESLATHLSASIASSVPSSSDDSSSSSSPSSASEAAAPSATSSDVTALASLRIIGPFEAAVQRLLPIQRALVSMNAQWRYLNGPDSPNSGLAQPV